MPNGIASSPKGGAKSRSVFKLDETKSKIAKGSPFGRAGERSETERASPSPESRYAAISRFFDRAMLSLRLFLSVSVLALSAQ